MNKKIIQVFDPEVPPDLKHALLVREEALEWLEAHYPTKHSFTTGEVLRMAGEPDRRWLITRLRKHGIGNQEEFSLPDTADSLTTLFLRSKGVKFHDAVEAVIGKKTPSREQEPKYGGVWNRLIITAMDGIQRRVPARLLGSVIFSLLSNPDDQFNCLVIVKRLARLGKKGSSDEAKIISSVSHDYVYHMILERPAPSCSVITPSRELIFFGEEQLPTRSEVTSRHFISIHLSTEIESYELVVGTIKPVVIKPDGMTLPLVCRILDIVYPLFDVFLQSQLTTRLDTPVEPQQTSANDLQLWLITQLLTSLYSGSLCEISESLHSTQSTRILASSVAKPWEPTPFEPVKGLEMLSGYASQTGIPLVVGKVELPLNMIIEGIDTELRYLKSKQISGKSPGGYSALALPIISNTGDSLGSLYILMPQFATTRLEIEVRILDIFSRIIGETIERHKAAIYTVNTTANVVSQVVLKREQFKAAILNLLNQKVAELHQGEINGLDVRLPFILISVHGSESDQFDTAKLNYLKKWLVSTLHNLEWRSFIENKESKRLKDWGKQGFMGDIPGIGIMIALGSLVSKDELDKIRNVFPSTFNQTYPTNSPVRLVSWVLDVPVQRLIDAAEKDKLVELADRIESWAFNVATLVDDLAQSSSLRDQGEWEASLKKIRGALQKPTGRSNSYLYRLAADCTLALGDWPSALKYALESINLSSQELGSGLVRSLCLAGDAYLCLANPVGAWDLYSEAAMKSPSHPLPPYYRGKGLLLIARLLKAYEEECLRKSSLNTRQCEQIDKILKTLVYGAMEDLTLAADLLDRWGLIPELYQYKNFHLVPTLIGQSLGYLLTHNPGPAASRLQSARRSFPKDDLFFREFLFAKCWEQGVHRQYAEALLSNGWENLSQRLDSAFGKQ
jgi:hypothetical protein